MAVCVPDLMHALACPTRGTRRSRDGISASRFLEGRSWFPPEKNQMKLKKKKKKKERKKEIENKKDHGFMRRRLEESLSRGQVSRRCVCVCVCVCVCGGGGTS